MQEITLRQIAPADNTTIAKIIRDSLTEFGANKPGTVYYDETTDHLYELFQQPGAGYFMATINSKIAGAAGIYPSPGLPEGVCELVKMYLEKEARGKGIGKQLMEHCLDFAKQAGYTTVYIETLPELKLALGLYERFGFEYLDGPLGNTGHFGCDVWMKKKL